MFLMFDGWLSDYSMNGCSCVLMVVMLGSMSKATHNFLLLYFGGSYRVYFH